FTLHKFKDTRHRGLLKISQVHGNLGQAAHLKSGSFHVAQSSRRKTRSLGDFLSYVYVGCVQEDVVSNQCLARSYYGCAAGGMASRLAKIRAARLIGENVFTQAFELPPAYILQILPFRPGGRRLVQIYRNLVALPYFRAYMLRDSNAILNSYAFNGDEGHHVSGANARMRALMLVQINQLRGFACTPNYRLGDVLA